MSHATILFFLSFCIIILIAIIVYQQFMFRKGIQKNLKDIGIKLEEILDSESKEKIMCFTINECCRENVLDFYEILTQKNFEVEIKIPEQPIFIQGNKDALQCILFNLISNTIRYGFEGKYLGVFIYSDQTYVYIDIVDKGKGIEKTFAKTVFDRLFTMEDSRNREIQGNGLGLTIAKNLVNQLDGDIFLCSEPNICTTFTVKFKKILY